MALISLDPAATDWMLRAISRVGVALLFDRRRK